MRHLLRSDGHLSTGVGTRSRRRTRRPGLASADLATFVMAGLVAFGVGLVAHVHHVGHHAAHSGGLLADLVHWGRDSMLAVPLAFLAIYAVTTLSRLRVSWARTRPVVARLRWGVLVGLGYAYLLIPGAMAHSKLFPAEHHGADLLRHALADAVALLPSSVYLAVGTALLLGLPHESTLPVARLIRSLGERLPSRLVVARVAVALVTAIAVLPVVPTSPAEAVQDGGAGALAQGEGGCVRTVTADVVALDQDFYYNRLGSLNANGMIYALRRDVVDNTTGLTEAEGLLQDPPVTVTLTPGNVSLRPDKRVRPLTLRANEGDCLTINFTNLLDPNGFIFNLPPEFPTGQILGLGVPIDPQIDDQPLTRVASIHVDGLELRGTMLSDGSNVGTNADLNNDGVIDSADFNADTDGDGVDDAALAGLVVPGDSAIYEYYAANRGTHLLYSMGTTLGGEGNGGTRSFGLFGAVNIQPAGSEFYRSQLTREEMDWAASAWIVDPVSGGLSRSPGDVPIFQADGVTPQVVYAADGQPLINYNAVYPVGAPHGKDGLPIVEILDDTEIVHSDLNAIIDDRGFPYPANDAYPTRGSEPFREFTVIFHDEAFGVQAFPGFYNDPVLGHTLHSVRDSFPINYGSGGIGSEIIANRLGVGPMWDCAECKYEEFFLTSFTVGDPAMIVDIPANTTGENDEIIAGPKATMALYPDDPSNVHHAYLGDRVVFRNLHAGPKEHHIFHLHAHQWQFNPDDPQSTYLDGQAIGPGSGYSYEIAYGGSGNRNLTPGDSIFHCHFYPHFAQGMWELWRVHDTFERGTLLDADGRPVPGARALPDGEIVAGTPIPAVVPMPGIAMAPMPDPAATVVGYDLRPETFVDLNENGVFDAGVDELTYDENRNGLFDAFTPDSSQFDANGDGTADIDDLTAAPASNPGYPWYTPGLVGHRPPTPALDLVDDGGLPRHVITSGPDEDNLAHAGAPIEMYVSRLDFNKVLHEATAIEIPEAGTAAEVVAMNFHAQQFHASSMPIEPGSLAPVPGPAAGDFETNGLPPVAGAPFADPCRAFNGLGPWTLDYPGGTVRTIKGANIEMPIVLNKVGWHFQQQRFEALWEDVVPTLTHARAPQPMVMRLNSTDCAEYSHTNLVPNVYQLDDYQVRTPTDIIGQHIHLVKFDVMAADGSANGWNYEDGTLSPDEVVERIHALNNGGGLDGNTNLAAQHHPFFSDPANVPIYVCEDGNGLVVSCDSPDVERAGPDLDGDGAPDQNWLGARTTVQRWYADPLLERGWDGGVGTVFTHDHYGPSTHQQVGLYSTLLIEPQDSVWLDNETGEQIGFQRTDGGPSSWQAIIVDCATGYDLGYSPDADGCAADGSSPAFEAHREFYFEFADFQHAYELDGGALGTRPNENLLGPSVDIPTYDDFDDAINPSFRQPPANPEDIFFHPNWCPGTTFNPDGTVDVPVARPCPEAISADDPGTYALNFRNEPIGLRVFNGQLGAGAGQTPGVAGDLAFAYQSRTDRAIPELNVQPETNGISPYPPLTSDVRPGDPWTPLLRVYMGDKVRIRIQVGAHEEEHNFTIPGLKWRQETNSPNSGWRNSAFFGIDEYFNLDMPIVPDTASGSPTEVDYIYTVGAELEGMWNGVWGILRSYGHERGDLFELPENNVGRNGYTITNEADFNGMCPLTAPLTTFDLTAVRAVDVLDPIQGLVYNSRATALTAPRGGVNGSGPLIDPTALIYVRDDDLTFDPVTGAPNGLKPGVPIEPLMLRVNAGDCVEVNLTNALPADLGATEMPGYNGLPPIVHKDKNADGLGGITTFNANDVTPSSYVGLTPQLLAFDPRSEGGFSTGLTTGKLVAPGDTENYTWYAGDVTVANVGVQGQRTQFTLTATPVEFGAVGLMPADRIKGTENGFVGAMVVEPQDSCWMVDPGTRAQATVWKQAQDGAGLSLIGECGSTPESSTDSFRDFIVVMQNDVNLRYGGDAQVVNPDGTLGATFNCAADPSPMECAVHSIAAEGPLGAPEDPQDTGQKAMNYGADPLWFRLGITPDTPFGSIHRNAALKDLIPDVFSNFLDIGDGLGQIGDPQVPVFEASPNGPEYGRFRVLMPGGHARGVTWTMHGHDWQRYPYVNDSSEIGDNPISEYYGAQEGINPTGHWEFVVNLGGYGNVTGDYLLRDQASFGSYQGLWALLRFDHTAPVVPDQQYELPKYTAIDLDLLGVAFDLDGDATTVTVTGGPSFGTLTDPEGDGVYTYESTSWPDCGDPFACTDTFTYTVTDAQGNSDTATVTLTITNTAPEANNDTIIIKDPDTSGSVDVLLNDVDAEGDLDPSRNPVVTLIGQPVDRDGNQVGTIADAVLGADGRTLTYTPPAGHTGVVLISYTVTDESGAVSNVAMIRAAVNVDDITITNAQYQPVNERWTIGGTCTDPFLSDGSTPTEITIFFGPTIEGDPPVIGTADCVAGDPVGTWSFIGTSTAPAPDPEAQNFVSAESALQGFYEGFPVSFAGQNNAPVAADDAYTIGEDAVLNGDVLANDVDADFDPLTAVLVGDVTNGTLVLNADGSFTYTPDADVNGSDTFTYQADDGKDLSNVATVTITIDAVNDPPTAVDDGYTMAQGAALNVAAPGVLANDFDVEGDTFALNTTPISGPAAGNSLTLNADGSFTYTPDSLFTGIDSFGYEICETATPELLCGQATVTISVGVNDAPVAVDDAYDAVQNTDLVVAAPGVLGNDTDADGDPLTVSAVNGAPADVGVAVTLASGATLTLNADGSFTYTPLFNFTGVDSFTYVANDETVDSNTATVTITVQEIVVVTDATYRQRQDRWRVSGTISDPTKDVDVFLCRAADQPPMMGEVCATREFLGAASVDDISGSWSFNGSSPATTEPTGAPPVSGDFVIAISSVGVLSEPVAVILR